MKLAQLVPIQNCVINGCSLIENVFGANFVVYDVMGDMFTTVKNARLYCNAQTLIEDAALHAAPGLSYALAQLREEADLLQQADYDRAVARESRYAVADSFMSLADSLQ